MDEKWLPIKGYEELYEISNIGRIRRIKTVTCGHVGLIKSTQINKLWGYRTVSLYKNGKQKGFRIARLVAIAFIPNQENKEQVNHKNGIKTDDSVDNLEWNTRSENQLHSIRAGLRSAKGIKNSQAKLTDDDIRTIRSLCAAMTQSAVSRKFNVHSSTISNIINGHTWKHIK